MLITNVASHCGHTERKYTELNDLHLRYNARGLSILGFPCNQFNSQEPGTSDQIMSFTKKKGVRFELFQKVDVDSCNWIVEDDKAQGRILQLTLAKAIPMTWLMLIRS